MDKISEQKHTVRHHVCNALQFEYIYNNNFETNKMPK